MITKSQVVKLARKVDKSFGQLGIDPNGDEPIAQHRRYLRLNIISVYQAGWKAVRDSDSVDERIEASYNRLDSVRRGLDPYTGKPLNP